jgi:hypothetical protein
MAALWWCGRARRVARLVLWLAVIMLLAGGALAYSCAPADSLAGHLAHSQTVTAMAGE